MKKHKFIILAVLLPILLLSGCVPVSNARTEIAAEQQQEEETASDPSPAIDDELKKRLDDELKKRLDDELKKRLDDELKKRLDDGKFEYEVDDGSITITKYTGTAASVTIPHGVTSIGMEAFRGCENLTSVTIPDSVTSIGPGAFFGCKSLTSVTIPDSVTSIRTGAFTLCESLTSVTIPDSVTTIDSGPFGFCSKLTEIRVSAGNTHFKSEDGILFTADRKTLVQVPAGKGLTEYTIPDSVTTIGDGAFCDCENLTSVTIPDSVTTIGEGAFSCCTSLTSVTIPESVTTIGESAFKDCENLTSVTIPESVTTIGEEAFFGCKSLTIYGKAGSEAENYAKENKINFQEQSSSSMTTPTPANEAPPTEETGSVTHTPENPMSTRERLEKELERNFRYTIIGDSVMITEYTGTAASVTIPHGVTIIGMEAFRGCENLTSVTIPDSVTNIGPGAFFGCKSLTSVTIPDSVTSIRTGAFTLCESLTSVTIPDSVTTIDSGPFGFCSKLTEIRVSAGNTHFKSEDGILFTADRKTLVQVPAGKGLTEYTIPDSVTTIGGSAFGCCESLTSVTIPDSVTTIREGAFEGCNRLTIYGKAGSEAERYAKERGTKFQVK